MVLAGETEVEQRAVQRPRVGSHVDSHDEDRARLARLFRSPPVDHLERKARRPSEARRFDRPGRSARMVQDEYRERDESLVDREASARQVSFQVAPRRASPPPAPAADGSVWPAQQLQWLQALKSTPKGSGPVGAYLRLMRDHTQGNELDSALADPNSGCTDPATLHPLLKEGFQIYHQIAFTMDPVLSASHLTFLRPRDPSRAADGQVTPELADRHAFHHGRGWWIRGWR